MGTTLRDIIFDIGGGAQDGKAIKAVQTGGPSGGCLPVSQFDLPVDYEALAAAGSMMGSGGMVVMDESACMVDVARYFLKFLSEESCGKCVPCRLGTDRMLEILTDITEGRGRMEQLDTLRDLAWTMAASSLCALGKTAPNPVLSTLQYFEERVRGAHQGPPLSRPGSAMVCCTTSSTRSCARSAAPCADVCPHGAIIEDDGLPDRPGAVRAVRHLRGRVPGRSHSTGSERSIHGEDGDNHGRRRDDPGARGSQRPGGSPRGGDLHPEPLPHARRESHRCLPGVHRRGGRGRSAQDDRVAARSRPARAWWWRPTPKPP